MDKTDRDTLTERDHAYADGGGDKQIVPQSTYAAGTPAPTGPPPPSGDPHQRLAAMDRTLERLRTRPTLATGTPPNDAAQLIARDLLNTAIVLAQYTGWTVQNVHTLVTATFAEADAPRSTSGITPTSHASTS